MILNCVASFVLICVCTFETRGAEASPENLGLARWANFESMLQQYRVIVMKGSTRDEQTKNKIDEFVNSDSQIQIASLRKFFKGRLMLLVTGMEKDSPGLYESELASKILSNVTEIEHTLWGVHADLHGNSSLLERLEVAIKYAKAMEAVFPSRRADEKSSSGPKAAREGEGEVEQPPPAPVQK